MSCWVDFINTQLWSPVLDDVMPVGARGMARVCFFPERVWGVPGSSWAVGRRGLCLDLPGEGGAPWEQPAALGDVMEGESCLGTSGGGSLSLP